MRAAMLPNVPRTAGAVTSAVALLGASASGASDARLVVRVYDTASGDATGRSAALRVAGQAMTDAGVSVDWRDCSRGGAAHPCRTVRGERELVVRIMLKGAA